MAYKTISLRLTRSALCQRKPLMSKHDASSCSNPQTETRTGVGVGRVTNDSVSLR